MIVKKMIALATVTAVVTASIWLPTPSHTRKPVEWWNDLPVDQWVDIDTDNESPVGFRTDHGGAVYDPDERLILLFGADTHQRHHDNSVLALDLSTRRWRSLTQRSPRYAMRTDALGRRISGVIDVAPWPMHAYDALVFDRRASEMLVLSGARHSMTAAAGRQSDPLWIFSVPDATWRIASPAGGSPVFFAAGADVDDNTGTVYGYASLATDDPLLAPATEYGLDRDGVWQLAGDRKRWTQIEPRAHHFGWFNVEVEQQTKSLAVYGGSNDSDDVWLHPLQTGRWLRTQTGTTGCGGGFYFPAVYAAAHNVTLFLPPMAGRERSATCIRNLTTGKTAPLPKATLPWVGLNYTMIFTPEFDLFVLVTGSFSRGEPVAVKALRLSPAALQAQKP